MNEDDVNTIADGLSSIQFAIESVGEGVNRYVCETCEGTGQNPHTFATCEDCEGDGDHLLSAIREIRNTLKDSVSYQQRIAVALEQIAGVRS